MASALVARQNSDLLLNHANEPLSSGPCPWNTALMLYLGKLLPVPVIAFFRSRRDLLLEHFALRQQLAVLKRRDPGRSQVGCFRRSATVFEDFARKRIIRYGARQRHCPDERAESQNSGLRSWIARADTDADRGKDPWPIVGGRAASPFELGSHAAPISIMKWFRRMQNAVASGATREATNRIAERKLRDTQARRAQIISAARRIAELEGWPNVTVRRLSDEISYSQPVLYAHFGSRDGILSAVAIEGFQELGMALKKARKRVKRGNTVGSVAAAYLEFAASSPALYEVMFSLSLSVPFDDAATPPELRFAFSQLLELFQRQSSKSEVLSEVFWASLHGIAELTRT